VTPRLLTLTTTQLERDPRASRAERAALTAGLQTAHCSLAPAGFGRPRPRVRGTREIAGLARLARLVRRTAALRRTGRMSHADIVHAHDLDTLPAGWLIARRAKARLVYDAHELYTGFDRDPPRLWLAVARRLEGALARRAAAVVTVSDEIADELARRYGLARRPLVVLNCPPAEDVTVEPHDGPLRAIYQAAAGPGRDLADLPAVDGVEVHARVLGASSAPPHVTLHEPVAPELLIAALAPFDVGLVIDRPETENARLALPNKLFEYLMAGLAVVVPDVPAMARLVEREGVGRTYAPGRLGDVLAALAADRPAVEEMRRRARTAAIERYNAEAQRPALLAAWGL
jgi:glycogen synthase